MRINLREGTRRLALLLGVAGLIGGSYVSYLELQSTLEQREHHKKFEQLANSEVVQQERKSHAGWVTIDPKTGERTAWEQQVDKGGIKTILWTTDNDIESIEAKDGQTLYPSPAPAAWQYLFVAFTPILGFFIPWGVTRAIGWMLAGFVIPSM
jgi:hypothetical protein